MSNEEFFGRPITETSSDIQFDLCEICLRKSPTWLEVQYQDSLAVVRFACNDCHMEYVQTEKVENHEIIKNFDPEDEIEDVTRPGWIDDFLKEGGDNIQTIDTSENVETVSNAEPDDTVAYSEAPESFFSSEENVEEVEYSTVQLAIWAPKFIEQALFGSDPEKWLEEQGGFEEDNISSTLLTLGNFASNEITSVKLSAIQCLLGLFNRNPSKGDDVKQQLGNFQIDSDLTVSDFAAQTIQQIK